MSCGKQEKYLCEKIPQCLEPTFTATGCDWINPKGRFITLKPEKVRHITDSPCHLTVTRSVGTDSFPPLSLTPYTAIPNCATKSWNDLDAGEIAQIELNPMLLGTKASL